MLPCIHLLGQRFDRDGNKLPPEAPPPPKPTQSDRDYSPFQSRVAFETAELLYKREQMSAGNIDDLLELWTASVVELGGDAPFPDHDTLYSTIDDIPLGDVRWESFTMQYNGEKPERNVPTWMNDSHEVWYRDPKEVIRLMLANPDFNGEMDFAPLQEIDQHGVRFKNLMSGGWAWEQAVCSCSTQTLSFQMLT